jgi:hypothetical protein
MENYTVRNTNRKYSINIDNMIYQKIMHWIDKAPGEISGLGKLTLDKVTGLIEIKSAVLLTQQNTGTSTDIDAAAVGKAMFEMRDQPGELNWWWHSHVNMGVFWSGTDLDTIREIGDKGFVVATVFNKKREIKSCLYYPSGNPLFDGVLIDDLETRVMDYIQPELITQWNTEFEEKCTVKTYLPTTSWNDYSDSNFGGTDWYKNFQTDEQLGKRSEQFDFDHGISQINDDAKIYSIQPQLEILAAQMLSQLFYSKARHYLHMISGRINKLKMNDATKSYELKQVYIKMFNDKFPEGMKNVQK